MVEFYRTNAKFRAFLRALVAGVIAYAIQILGAGQAAFALDTFLWGFVGVVIYSVAGILTPLEPNVGVKADVQTTPTTN